MNTKNVVRMTHCRFCGYEFCFHYDKRVVCDECKKICDPVDYCADGEQKDLNKQELDKKLHEQETQGFSENR